MSLAGLRECASLEEVAAQGNSLEGIEWEVLARSGRLRRLALQRNRIKSVGTPAEGALPTLEHLLLQGNAIQDLASLNLQVLAKAAPNLRSLYLQNYDGSEANPVALSPGYRAATLANLPSLRNLDGERLRGTRSMPSLEGEQEQEQEQRVTPSKAEGLKEERLDSFFPSGVPEMPRRLQPVPQEEVDALRSRLAACAASNADAKGEIRSSKLLASVRQ